MSQIFKLLKVVIDQDFFTFNESTYRQDTGLAMGSPLSPFLADLFLNQIERDIISKLPHFKQVSGWFRYVDDILVIFSGSEQDIETFHQSLNSIRPSLKFTIEHEVNSALPFLDLNIMRVWDRLSFSIYRKPTTTDHIIPAHSAHPYEHKISSFYSLFYRLFNIPMCESSFNEELGVIKTIAQNNGYTQEEIRNIFNKINME